MHEFLIVYSYVSILYYVDRNIVNQVLNPSKTPCKRKLNFSPDNVDIHYAKRRKRKLVTEVQRKLFCNYGIVMYMQIYNLQNRIIRVNFLKTVQPLLQRMSYLLKQNIHQLLNLRLTQQRVLKPVLPVKRVSHLPKAPLQGVICILMTLTL